MGLFGRMMRDRGFNFFAYDRHQFPFYMDQFHANDPSTLEPALITSHEVLEHLADPGRELTDIFGRGAELVIVSTEIFQGQGPDWSYLAPHHGQHVFFYAQRAMEMIGARFGYNYATIPMLHVFWRAELGNRSNILGALRIANDPQQFGQIVLQAFLNHAAAPYHHAIRDMDAIAMKAVPAR